MIDRGVDDVVERYDDFASAVGAVKHADGCDGRANGADACAVRRGAAITGGREGIVEPEDEYIHRDLGSNPILLTPFLRTPPYAWYGNLT